MAEFDFKTVGVVLGLLGGSGGIAVFKNLFAQPGKHAAKIDEVLKSPRARDNSWLRGQCWEVLKALLSPIRLFLSILYLGILVGFAYVLLRGPENIFTPESWGPLAEHLKEGERLLYAFMYAQLVCVYGWLVAVPAWHGWVAVSRAIWWLWKRR